MNGRVFLKLKIQCPDSCTDATVQELQELAKQKGHRVDALALRADERRDKLR